MSKVDDLFPRHAHAAIVAALADTRVVVINGARQTGKSTLAQLVAAEHSGSTIRYLDDGCIAPTPRSARSSKTSSSAN